MRHTLLTLAVVTGFALGLTWFQSAEAQLPGKPCHEGNAGMMVKRMVFEEAMQIWVLREFLCTLNDFEGWIWNKSGWTWARWGTEKPDSWNFSGEFDENRFPVITTPGSTPLARPPKETSYWDVEVSTQLQRQLSRHIYAGEICAALREPGAFVEGVSIDPYHVYRVGNAWHYIPDADDRAAFDRPDATMARIWAYNHRPTNVEGTYILEVKIPSCHSEEYWETVPFAPEGVKVIER